MALRLNSYMHDNDLNEKYQSAYKPLHNTATALVCIANNMRRCVDKKKAVVLVLFDLPAAFDTVDQHILLDQAIGNSRHFFILVSVVFE